MNPLTILAAIHRSVHHAAAGIRYAFRYDTSFRLEVLLGLPIYLIVWYLLAPLSFAEASLYIFSYFFILTVELINTAFETVLRRLHPLRHHLIGSGKDIAAGAVLMSFLFAIVIVSVIALARIM